MFLYSLNISIFLWRSY